MNERGAVDELQAHGAAGGRRDVGDGCVAAQAALQDRDLDGNGVTDAFYDTDLDITWLRDANGSGHESWYHAVTWAGGINFGGFSGWRLPTSDHCTGYDCTGSEMGHLWYVELGNPAGGPMANTGGFQNLQNDRGVVPTFYWSGTENEFNSSFAYNFFTGYGSQSNFANLKSERGYAMAVHDGDVAAVPEPATGALLLAGLAAIGAAARRRNA